MNRFLYILWFIAAFTSCQSDDSDTSLRYKLLVEVNPKGGGSVTPASGSFEKGKELTLMATPSDRYVFKSWSGDLSGNENPINLIMADDMVITAIFEKQTFSLSIDIRGQGQVKEEIAQSKSEANYQSGTNIELTAIPVDGWEFAGWEGDIYGAENPVVISMNQDMSILATFEPLPIEYTLISDEKFEQALIDLGYDDIIDGFVVKSTISNIETLDVSAKDIKSLSGISDFKNLKVLWCERNRISKLELNENKELKTLICSFNDLRELDVSQNPNLTTLECNNNVLSAIDLSSSIQKLYCEFNAIRTLNVDHLNDLEEFSCKENIIRHLDFSSNSNLRLMYCQRNALQTLNMKNGNNNQIAWFNALNNPELNCIEVSDVIYAERYWSNTIDTWSEFSEDCGYD